MPYGCAVVRRTPAFVATSAGQDGAASRDNREFLDMDCTDDTDQDVWIAGNPATSGSESGDPCPPVPGVGRRVCLPVGAGHRTGVRDILDFSKGLK